jgi:hypothetical protein
MMTRRGFLFISMKQSGINNGFPRKRRGFLFISMKQSGINNGFPRKNKWQKIRWERN